jgi:hypothetical protein
MDSEEFFEKTYLNAGAVNKEIEKLEEEKPDARTKMYGEWEKKINHLYSIYNKLANFAAYKLIK